MPVFLVVQLSGFRVVRARPPFAFRFRCGCSGSKFGEAGAGRGSRSSACAPQEDGGGNRPDPALPNADSFSQAQHGVRRGIEPVAAKGQPARWLSPVPRYPSHNRMPSALNLCASPSTQLHPGETPYFSGPGRVPRFVGTALAAHPAVPTRSSWPETAPSLGWRSCPRSGRELCSPESRDLHGAPDPCTASPATSSPRYPRRPSR